jgi:hypothetical protein
VTHPTPFILRVIRLPVGRRASGFVLVGKGISTGPTMNGNPLRRIVTFGAHQRSLSPWAAGWRPRALRQKGIDDVGYRRREMDRRARKALRCHDSRRQVMACDEETLIASPAALPGCLIPSEYVHPCRRPTRGRSPKTRWMSDSSALDGLCRESRSAESPRGPPWLGPLLAHDGRLASSFQRSDGIGLVQIQRDVANSGPRRRRGADHHSPSRQIRASARACRQVVA